MTGSGAHLDASGHLVGLSGRLADLLCLVGLSRLCNARVVSEQKLRNRPRAREPAAVRACVLRLLRVRVH